MPPSTTYTANLAPAHMRGRYMSIYTLTWGVAQGIAPLGCGFLAAPWLGGGFSGLLAASAFFGLSRRKRCVEPGRRTASFLALNAIRAAGSLHTGRSAG